MGIIQNNSKNRTTNITSTSIDIIKKILSDRVPGLLDILNLYSIRLYNKEALQLLLESPCNFYKLINNIYGNTIIATYILVNLFLKHLSKIIDQDLLQSIYQNMNECLSNIKT